jgi:hypothetical protein
LVIGGGTGMVVGSRTGLVVGSGTGLVVGNVGGGTGLVVGSGTGMRGLCLLWIRMYFHLRHALNEVGGLQVPGNLKIETLLVKNGSLVDELRVNGNAVGKCTVQALESVHISLQTSEEVAHFFVAA